MSTTGQAAAMGDVETLKGLLERVRAAKGSDRQLDRAIAEAFPPPGGWYDEDFIPSYCIDTDDVIELAERTLPAIKAFAQGGPPSSGWKINLYRGMTPTSARYGYWQVNIREHASDGFNAQATTLPLAILSALLQALIAQTEGARHGE